MDNLDLGGLDLKRLCYTSVSVSCICAGKRHQVTKRGAVSSLSLWLYFGLPQSLRIVREDCPYCSQNPLTLARTKTCITICYKQKKLSNPRQENEVILQCDVEDDFVSIPPREHGHDRPTRTIMSRAEAVLFT